MFGFLRQKLSIEEMIERSKAISKNFNSKLHVVLGKSDPFIEVEIFLYLYTVADYWMMMTDRPNEERAKLFKIADQTIKENPDWIDSRYEKEKLEKVMDDRIKNYFKILEENGKRMEQGYFKLCVDYQTQLTANIIQNHEYSFYNPVPKSPKEYSAIITDFLLTSSIKSALIENMDMVIELIKAIRNSKN